MSRSKRRSFWSELREKESGPGHSRRNQGWYGSPLEVDSEGETRRGNDDEDDNDMWSFRGRTPTMQISLADTSDKKKTPFRIAGSSHNIVKEPKTGKKKGSPMKRRIGSQIKGPQNSASPKVALSRLSDRLRKINESATKVKARSLQTIRGRRIKTPTRLSTPKKRAREDDEQLRLGWEDDVVLSPIYQPPPDILDSSITVEESPAKRHKRKRRLDSQSPKVALVRSLHDETTLKNTVIARTDCPFSTEEEFKTPSAESWQDSPKCGRKSMGRRRLVQETEVTDCETKLAEAMMHAKINTFDSDENVLVNLSTQPEKADTSILVEESPVKLSKVRKRLVSRSPRTPSQNHISQFYSEAWSPSTTVSSQPSEHRVSEYISSTSQSSDNRTPISVWIHQDGAAKCEDIENQLSPKRKRAPSCAETAKRKVAALPTTSSSLLEEFLAIKTRYDSSARLFAHDLRNGRYDEETAMPLMIRKIVDRQDKLVQVIAYDLKDNLDRWALFKPCDALEFDEGSLVMLYPPWQEIKVSGCEQSVIICTDFHKIVKNDYMNLCEEQMNHIRNLELPTLTGIKTSDSLFMKIVPFHIRNQNTIEKEIDQFKTQLDISIVILHCWTQSSPAFYLVKDSNDFLSFLEVSRNKMDSAGGLQRGKSVIVSDVAVARKTCITSNLVPFSVLHVFGGKQRYFYILRLTNSSSVKPEPQFKPTLPIVNDRVTDFDDILVSAHTRDHRITIKCIIREKEEDYVLVTDEESDRSLKIEFIYDIEHDLQEIRCKEGSVIKLRFVRVILGKALWDMFTTYEEVDDEDDV